MLYRVFSGKMHHPFFIRFRLVWSCLAFIAFGQPAAAGPPDWPMPPSRLQVLTPYGTLGVRTSEYIYGSKLVIDDVDVDPKIEGLLNITYVFKTADAQAALISINTGNNSCPVTYRWVILKDKGYKVSPPLGSCSQQIKVSATSKKFTVKTPSNQKPDKIDIYTYDGKIIKQQTRSQ